MALSRRSAPSSSRLDVSSLARDFAIFIKPFPHETHKRDSHLALSVREAFGMTPIHVPGSQSQFVPEGHLAMDMELDIDPSDYHVTLPPLLVNRFGVTATRLRQSPFHPMAHIASRSEDQTVRMWNVKTTVISRSKDTMVWSTQ